MKPEDKPPSTPSSAIALPSKNQTATRLPKRPYLSALKRLSRTIPAVEADFDSTGHIRHLTTGYGAGFFDRRYIGTPVVHASRFLSSEPVREALGLRHVELVDGRTEKFDFGTRVEFAQIISLKDGSAIPVHGGFLHVFMDGGGHILSLTSTLKFGRRPQSLGRLLGEAKALALAEARLGAQAWTYSLDLVMVARTGRLTPAYLVKVSLAQPPCARSYLIAAKSGEILEEEDLLRARHLGAAQPAVAKGVTARCFLTIPDHAKPVDGQVFDRIIEGLPDPTVLKNERFEPMIYDNMSWRFVRAAADGTFNFSPSGGPLERAKFSATAAFVALNEQFELYESWGMKKQTKTLTVFVEDASVQNNAFFDPYNYRIHIGVGSGVPFGFFEHMGWDLGVEWHENSHHAVSLQTPAHDLHGAEGSAMHEATGDVLGELLMKYWFRLKYARQLGMNFSVADIMNDPRVIGSYVKPPNGVRIQRNQKKDPDDKTGKPHSDGLIAGGAGADLLQALIERDNSTIEESLAVFGKLYLAALSLMPAGTVVFADLLRAFVTADQLLNAGANRQLIEDAFAAHGICLPGKSTFSQKASLCA